MTVYELSRIELSEDDWGTSEVACLEETELFLHLDDAKSALIEKCENPDGRFIYEQARPFSSFRKLTIAKRIDAVRDGIICHCFVIIERELVTD